MGVWMAQQGSGGVQLLGRGGRLAASHGRGGQVLVGSATGASTVRCDMSLAEEAAAFFGPAAAGRDTATRSVMHAGGVLHDALTGKQSAVRLRRVCAPKLAGAGSSGWQAAGSAFESVLLFSSTTALSTAAPLR